MKDYFDSSYSARTSDFVPASRAFGVWQWGKANEVQVAFETQLEAYKSHMDALAGQNGSGIAKDYWETMTPRERCEVAEVYAAASHIDGMEAAGAVEMSGTVKRVA
eukprot:6201695-Pleurochrysis_carterae.AAC.1